MYVLLFLKYHHFNRIFFKHFCDILLYKGFYVGNQRQVELSVNWRHIVVQPSLNFWFSWSAKLIFYEIVVLYWAWTVRRRRAAAAAARQPLAS